jgi:hypothetical protein
MRHKCLLASVGVGVVALAQLSTAWAQAGPDLVITMLHTGNFTVGENGVYTIVVSNIGGTATSGFYEVDDELNPGPYPGGIDFLFVSETGTGWSCSVNYHMPPNQNVSTACRSTSVIPPGGFAPPITLTVIPPVSGTFTNVADVGGGGGGTGSSASDPTIVVAAVPTLPQWAMMALSVLLVLTGVAALRRRTA